MNAQFARKAAYAVVGTLALVALAVPAWVRLDQYRGPATAWVNERIDGRLALGKFSLSLWGGLSAEIDGVGLTDQQGKKIASARIVRAGLSLTSLLVGSPFVSIRVTDPDLGSSREIRFRNPAPTSAADPPAGESPLLPSWILGLASRAHLELEIIADLHESWPGSIRARGAAQLVAHFQPRFSGRELNAVGGDFNLDFTRADVHQGTGFEKASGVPAGVQGKFEAFVADRKRLELTDFVFAFHRTVIQGTASIDASQVFVHPRVSAMLNSNGIDISAWAELVPALEDAELSGSLELRARVSGALPDLHYSADLYFDRVRGESSSLRESPRLDGVLKLVDAKSGNFDLQIDAPGTDLAISGVLASIEPLQLKLQLHGRKVDLDRLVSLPPLPADADHDPRKARRPGEAAVIAGLTAVLKRLPQTDQALLTLSANPRFATADVQADFSFGGIEVFALRMNEISGRVSSRHSRLAVEDLRMKLAGGSLQAALTADIKPPRPDYHYRLESSGIDFLAKSVIVGAGSGVEQALQNMQVR